MPNSRGRRTTNPAPRTPTTDVAPRIVSVYRRGNKDVHHAFGVGGNVYDHNPCHLDGGGTWKEGVPPDGPQCPVCFAARGAVMGDGPSPAGGVSARRRRSPDRPLGRWLAMTAALTVGLLALVASQEEPLGPVAALPTASLVPVGSSGSVPPIGPLPTSSSVPPTPPISTPVPTSEPQQVLVRVFTERIIRTIVESPNLGAPTPRPCRPGVAHGLHGSCKWGHRN